MKIILFGAGEIGRAIAQYFLYQDNLTQLVLIDIDKNQLITCIDKLSKHVNVNKVVLNNYQDIEKFVYSSDLIFAAVPWSAHSAIIELVIKYNKPMISVTRPAYNDINFLKKRLKKINSPVIIGCGLEPGLTEIMALYCASMYDRLDELHIKCGGITNNPPNNVLQYKALFGTKYLPIAMRYAYTVVDSKLIQLPRFSGVEPFDIPNIGQLEAWHDGMVPWLYQYSKISSAHTISQKTLRWPGFSQAVKTLNHLGLLSEKEIKINGCSISPKTFIEHLYNDETKLADEKNISILHISGKGLINQRKKNIELKLMAYNQINTGLNSMALITGFTASIIGSFVLNGKIKYTGLLNPELEIHGSLFDQLIYSLKHHLIYLDIKQNLDTQLYG
ncbi:MAG: hypothetical protein EPO11_04970 [Gammaproteobacteria bacterium]|nr:MAG: hypothetical protein EPO11_04970 [Gammaproteobacteria bacterium]